MQEGFVYVTSQTDIALPRAYTRFDETVFLGMKLDLEKPHGAHYFDIRRLGNVGLQVELQVLKTDTIFKVLREPMHLFAVSHLIDIFAR